MYKFLPVAAASVILLMAAPAQSQQIQSKGDVIDICRNVALNEMTAGDDQSIVRGLCINATLNYISVLQASGLTVPQFDQSVGDLVADLANLLFTPDCRLESEIAEAIYLSSSASRDAAQQKQITLIYQTVRACDFVVTAAIATPRINTFAPPSLVSGPSASDN